MYSKVASLASWFEITKTSNLISLGYLLWFKLRNILLSNFEINDCCTVWYLCLFIKFQRVLKFDSVNLSIWIQVHETFSVLENYCISLTSSKNYIVSFDHDHSTLLQIPILCKILHKQYKLCKSPPIIHLSDIGQTESQVLPLLPKWLFFLKWNEMKFISLLSY